MNRPLRAVGAFVIGATMFLVGACSDSGTSAKDIAEEACDLARRVASGSAGLGAIAEANDIARDARDNDIRISDVIAEARSICPDVIDELPL